MDSTVLFLLATALTYLAGVLLFAPVLRRFPHRAAVGDASAPRPPPLDAAASAPGEPVVPASPLWAQLHALALGEAALEPPPTAGPHRKVAAQIASAVAGVAADPRHAPRRPMLLPQLLRAANDDETSRADLAAIIARDPALVGSLLKLANSALHRSRPEPVESIDAALAVLGTAGLRSLVAAAVMQPMFRGNDARFREFAEIAWQHTLFAAAAAEAHAVQVEKTDRFAAQLLGLLFGLGSIVVFRIALERYASLPATAPHAAVIATALETHSADAAIRIAESWEVSDRLLDALRDQRTPEPGPADTPLGRSLRFGRLLGVLALLNARQAIDESTLREALRTTGAPAPQVRRIWARLAPHPE